MASARFTNIKIKAHKDSMAAWDYIIGRSPCFGGYGRGCLWTFCPQKVACQEQTKHVAEASVDELPRYLASKIEGERVTARIRYKQLRGTDP